MIIRIYNYLRPPLARNPRKYWLSAVSVGYFSVAFGGILRNFGAVPGNGGVHFRPLSSLGVIFRNSLPVVLDVVLPSQLFRKGSFSVTLPVRACGYAIATSHLRGKSS